jgi:diguanylate cyclase (GGDEF)-like protein/PAS domain S-box-containing protein
MSDIIKDRQVLVDAYIPISRTDLLGNIIYVNDAMCALTEYSREELIGKNHRILRCPTEAAQKYQTMWQQITNGKIWDGEVKNRTKNGRIFWVNAHIHPIFDEQHNLTGYQALRENITDKKELEFLSTHDNLTGVYNRSKFDELLNYEMEQFYRYKKVFSLAICDFDNFKIVNDTYGHQVGDDVLIQSIKVIKDAIRESDVLARWGGEEFTLLLPHTSKDKAELVLEKIRESIQNNKLKSVGNITVSCGLSEVRQDDTITSLMKRIDDALYHAKENGRNKTTVY